MSLIQTMTDALNGAIAALAVERTKASGQDEKQIGTAIDIARHAVLQAEDAELIRRVSIQRRSGPRGNYFVVEVRTHDLILTCDLVNERQLRLARRLAKDNGVELDFCVDLSELPLATVRASA